MTLQPVRAFAPRPHRPGEAAPSSPTGHRGATAAATRLRAPPPPPVATSADAKRIAGSILPAAADNAGGTLTPQFVNKFIDSVGSVAPQTEAAGAAVTGY